MQTSVYEASNSSYAAAAHVLLGYRLSGSLPGMEATLVHAVPRGRQTTAETVAALKANMGGDSADFR